MGKFLLLVFALVASGCAGSSLPFMETTSSVTPQSGAMLVAEDGRCPGEGEAGPPAAKGPALGMSECQVVGVMGPAEKIEIAANERGDRTAVLTYTKGERPGIYRFVGGLLTSIERGADPAPAKPDRRARPRA